MTSIYHKLLISEYGDRFEVRIDLEIESRGVRFILGVVETEAEAYELAHRFQEEIGVIWRE